MKSVSKLALRSIYSKPGRSFGVVMISLIMAFVFVTGSLVATGNREGSHNVVERMGADIIVVPEGHTEDIESLILSASKSSFYMNNDVIPEVQSVEGVTRISEQVFLMTLAASCCDSQVQVIGIDPESDFTVTPWIDTSYIDNLSDGSVIVGSAIGVGDDHTFRMFGKEYDVAAKLDESGSSMDYTVYVSIDTTDELLEAAAAAGQGILGEVDGQKVSAVLVDVDNPDDVGSVATRLDKIDGVDVITSDSVSQRVSASLNTSLSFFVIVLVAFFATGTIILYLISFITIRGRKDEADAFRVMGFSARFIRRLFLAETFILTSGGALTGTLIGVLFTALFSSVIKDSIDIPFMTPSVSVFAGLALLSFVIAAVTGPVSAFNTTRKVCPEFINE